MVTPDLDERTNQTLKTTMGKSLYGYQEWWENNLKVIIFAHNSSVQASRVLTLSPENAFEDHLQAWAEKDVEVFDQVRLNMDKAQEKQKESYRSRIKKGTKCYDIQANDLAWKMDEKKARPGKPCCSFAPSWGHHPLRT
ncbi:hypothetical protein J4Q44_G00132240 [Coregonus suidteri]|uniref:Uncharacterized protein n=1 Tax=Coregonus suidteri TaxID=861788 RepID=A0AAN8LZU4_9TELE